MSLLFNNSHYSPLLFCSHQKPIALETNWLRNVYDCPDNKFVVDIGCSKGAWAASYAEQYPNKNVLGLDIRQPVIDLALARSKKNKIRNVHFLKSNANVDISYILSTIHDSSAGGVTLLTIQFPDPYFKARHQKRRLVNDLFIQSIITGKVAVGTRVFVQTDVEEVMQAVLEVFRSNAHLVAPAPGHCFSTPLLNPAPFDLPTEREISCQENDNFSIYRVMVQTLTTTLS